MDARQLIKQVLLTGTPAEKRALFAFTVDDDERKILKKFKLFARSQYPRYFESPDAPFHDEMLLNYIRSYRGQQNGVEIAFRGAAKTALLKLFIVHVLLNDTDAFRKYIKILSKDLKNSKQITTDVYNLIIEVQGIYGDVFAKEGDKKREETMGGSTLRSGVKFLAGTVGTPQRGHLQDAYRPDWVIFEDVEDRESVSSITITEGIIEEADEAITGLSLNGTYQVNANYISDAGVVQWFLNKPAIVAHIVPIIDEEGNPTWARYTPEKIAELKANAEDWAGEYLCDPTRTGDKFFDVDRVNEDLEAAQEPIKTSAGARYFANYLPHHRYGIGLDLSDGVGKDSCALALFDFTCGELVVTAADNQPAPDLFTYEAVRVGREFGNCIIAPEINNTAGGIAIAALKDQSYPQVYQRELIDKVGNTLSKTLGWRTDAKTKPQMFYEFRKDYNDGLIKIRDARVLKEMKAFTKADLRDAKTAAVTRHFDLLTAACIAWQLKAVAEAASGVRDFYRNLQGEKSKTIASR